MKHLILTLLLFTNLHAVEPNVVSSGVNLGGTTLSSYDEGTFSPTIVGSTGGTPPTLSTSSGVYTKIGRNVSIQFIVAISAKNTPTGNIWIGGLPFPVKSGFGRAAAELRTVSNLTGHNISTLLGSYAGSSVIEIAGSTGSAIPVAQLTNTTTFHGTMIYVSE